MGSTNETSKQVAAGRETVERIRSGEKGPVYGVPLIRTLPWLNGGMFQAMPDREDLGQVARKNERVVAGYEVLLSYHHKLVEVLGEILDGEMPDEKARDEFGGYVLDDDVRAKALELIRKAKGGVS